MQRSSTWAFTLDTPNGADQLAGRVLTHPVRTDTYVVMGDLHEGHGHTPNHHIHCLLQLPSVARKPQAVRLFAKAVQAATNDKDAYIWVRATPMPYAQPVKCVQTYFEYMTKNEPGMRLKLLDAAHAVGWRPRWGLSLMARKEERRSKMKDLEAAVEEAKNSLGVKGSLDEFLRAVRTSFGIETGRNMQILKMEYMMWDDTSDEARFKEKREKREAGVVVAITDEDVKKFAVDFYDFMSKHTDVEFPFEHMKIKEREAESYLWLLLAAMSKTKRDNTPMCKQLKSLWIWSREQGRGKSLLMHFITGRRNRAKHLVTDATGVGRWKYDSTKHVMEMDDCKEEFIHANSDYMTLIKILDGEQPEVKVFASTEPMDAIWCIGTATWNVRKVYEKDSDGKQKNTLHHFHRRFVSIEIEEPTVHEKEEYRVWQEGLSKYRDRSSDVLLQILRDHTVDFENADLQTLKTDLLNFETLMNEEDAEQPQA